MSIVPKEVVAQIYRDYLELDMPRPPMFSYAANRAAEWALEQAIGKAMEVNDNAG